jgi:hypothetical protein
MPGVTITRRAVLQNPTTEITMIKSTRSNLNVSETAPHHLQECEEARDHLIRVFMAQGFCIAVFKFGAVCLPPEMEPRIRNLVGRKCAILRLDGKFHIRNLDEEAENAA